MKNIPITSPEIEWRDNGQPVSVTFDDTYFSVNNGLEESRYVFLNQNNLPERWRQWRGPFRIIETGFGTGLNFLATWQAFLKESCEHTWLEFTSIEKFPLSREQLRRALSLWPELDDLANQLLAQYPDATPGFHRLVWPDQRVALTLIMGDVHDALPQLEGPVNAWYLDGFTPTRNPDMWNEALFKEIRRISRPHPNIHTFDSPESWQNSSPTCATFTAASLVRRGLNGAGFKTQKAPGYGRKREMLLASYQQSTGPERPVLFDGKPWLVPTTGSSSTAPAHIMPTESAEQPKQQTAIVIGAGLAGCTTARALADRGFQVTVFDGNGIANGGSGNPQGGLYVKLAANDQAIHTDFYLQAYLLATQSAERILGPGTADNTSWQQCGVLQLATDDAELRRQQRFLATHTLPLSVIKPVSAEQASQQAGVPLTSSGLFFPKAGWVNPRQFCYQLLKHPAIRIHTRRVMSLAPPADAPYWTASCENGSRHTAHHVVIATANEAHDLLPSAYLPIRPIRGQLTFVDSHHIANPSTVLCGTSYMAPAAPGQAYTVMGATYNLRDTSTTLSSKDHQTNLNHLRNFGSRFAADLPSVQGGRVGFRCTTPDYLPLVGPVMNTSAFLKTYSPMVKNARQVPAKAAPAIPGLWLNVGHGSRGLASTPLCAELLANQIMGAAAPVSQAVLEALWPGRFLLRDMIRRKLPNPVTENTVKKKAKHAQKP